MLMGLLLESLCMWVVNFNSLMGVENVEWVCGDK